MDAHHEQAGLSFWTHCTAPTVICQSSGDQGSLASVVQAKEEGKEAEKVEPVMRTVSTSKQEWQVQNDSKPLWTRPPREVWLAALSL